MPDSKRPVTKMYSGADRYVYLEGYAQGFADAADAAAAHRRTLDEAQQAQADEAGQGEYPEEPGD